MGALALSQQQDGLVGRMGSRSALPKGLAGARRLPAAPAPPRCRRTVPTAAAASGRPAEVRDGVLAAASVIFCLLQWRTLASASTAYS